MQRTKISSCGCAQALLFGSSFYRACLGWMTVLPPFTLSLPLNDYGLSSDSVIQAGHPALIERGTVSLHDTITQVVLDIPISPSNNWIHHLGRLCATATPNYVIVSTRMLPLSAHTIPSHSVSTLWIVSRIYTDRSIKAADILCYSLLFSAILKWLAIKKSIYPRNWALVFAFFKLNRMCKPPKLNLVCMYIIDRWMQKFSGWTITFLSYKWFSHWETFSSHLFLKAFLINLFLGCVSGSKWPVIYPWTWTQTHFLQLLFDGGTVVNYLKTVKAFLDANPNEVLTLLFTNPEGQSVSTVWKPAFDAAGRTVHSPGIH